jgi:hypothetical protein
MNSSREPEQRTYTEDELAGLFTTYFGDKLNPTQLDSLVATVAQTHAERRARAAAPAERPSAPVSNGLAGPLTTRRGSVPRFFGGWAPA